MIFDKNSQLILRLGLTLLLAGFSEVLLAHARFTPNYLVKPGAPLKLRNEGDGLKNNADPCAGLPSADLSKRNIFRPGEEIEIQFEETIDHPAKYQISFARDETDLFDTVLMDLDQFADDTICPAGALAALNCVQTLPAGQDKNGTTLDDGTVLNRLNNPRLFKVKIKLPEVECDKCAIMLIQRMFDRNPPTNYHSCADLVLTNNPETLTQTQTTAPVKPTGFKVLKTKK